ncbi:hypothetical protein H4S03_002438 [Coemansia sp. S3946]|nr:hypothetical protein H4S03_002438 [Coemansia sp. S3946]
MSRAPSSGAGSSYANNSVHMLAIAPVPETPCIASLTVSSADDSDNGVQISLGIQQGIVHAWEAALESLGSLSLAWQSEVASARGGLTQPVDPALVFDGVSKPTATPLAQRPPDKPTELGSRTRGMYKRKEAVDSRFAAPAVPAWHMKGPPSIILEGATADSAGFRNTLSKPPARYSPRGATSNISVAPLSARASRKVSGHRLSIKLERLLPHRTLDSGTPVLHAPTLMTRSARGPPRRCSMPSDQIPSRRRAISHPQPAAKGAIFIRQRGTTDLTPPTNIVSAQQKRVSSVPDGMDTIDSLHDEQRLALLEAQVSDMFCELSLRSPYIQASRLAEQRTLTGSVHRGPEQAPWFYQKKYAEPAPPEERLTRRIILFDDDSSCPDSTVDYAHRRHSRSSYHYGETARMAFPDLLIRRRTTSTSVLSAADESIGSTAAGSGLNSSAHAMRGCEPARATACSSHDPPCHQFHSLQQRIEQADQYIHSVSRHALAISSMLAGLRKQSQALAELLTISQARAAPSPSQLPRGIDLSTQQFLPRHKRAKRAGKFAASSAAAAQRLGLESSSEDIDEDQSIRDRAKAWRQSRSGNCDPKASSPTQLGPERPSQGPKQVKCSQGQHRRPSQPVSVRMRRIDAQWGELCETIAALGIDMAATGIDVASNEQTMRHSATGIAVGGLKSIQRVLKNTLESLSAMDVRQMPGTSDAWATQQPVRSI